MDKDKWYVLFARTGQEKEEWMEAFRRERSRVIDDEKKGASSFLTDQYITTCTCI